MNIRKKISYCWILLFLVFCPKIVSGISLSGPVAASTVTVDGDVTMSNMSASTIAVARLLDVQGSVSGVQGLVLQTVFSSTTIQFDTSSSTFNAIPGLSATLALSNPNNYVRICLSGVLGSDSTSHVSYLAVTRDSYEISVSTLAGNNLRPGVSSVGITVIDFPGDVASHVYRANLSAHTFSGGTPVASFPVESLGSFIVEEIKR